MSSPSQPSSGSSGLSSSGDAAEQKFGGGSAGQTVTPCKKKTWVAIELKDNQGNPVPNEAYEIELPDGTKLQGALDEQGQAGVGDIDPGNCRIRFPDLDAKAWKPA